jgi:hypothetical protein
MSVADELRKLREELDQWHSLTAGIELPEYPVTQFKPKDLERENAKLRELVRDMYACISHANEADWFYFERDKLGCGMSCTVNGESCGLCALADRMRELGVGVDQ